VLQRGLIDDPESKVHYAFPSIGVNQYGDVLVGFSRFATNQYPSANFAWRHVNDPPGTLDPEWLLKEGEAPFVWPNPCVAQRTEWGWYSSTVVDPANDSDLWTVQQYAAAPADDRDRWGTWWGRFTPWPSLALRVEAPATVTSGRDPQLVANGSLKPENGSIPLRARIWNRAPFAVSNIVVRLENSRGCPVFALELPPGRIQIDAVDGGMGGVWTASMSTLREGEWVEILWGLCQGSPGHAAPPGMLTNLLSVTMSHEASPITVAGVTSVVSDADDDDLPDDWESANGLAVSSRPDADGDLDSDGLSNRQEFQAGTQPGDASSRVELLSVARVTAGTSRGWRLQVRTVSGRFYRIERTERLANPQWLTVADEIRGVSGTVAVTDPDTTSPGPRFYRAIALP
jgi:hypothetical protein